MCPPFEHGNHMKAAVLCLALAIGLLPSESRAQDAAAIVGADIRVERTRPHLTFVASAQSFVIAPGTRLLAFVGEEPLTEAAWIEDIDRQNVFEALNVSDLVVSSPDLRGWLVASDLVARLIARWPADAALQAEIDSVGPGSRAAWLRAGANQGVQVGDAWWLRVGGQPAARCEVRFVGPETSFCTLVQLAREWAVEPGGLMAAWPAPGERRAGVARSAVARIDERSNGTLVWVAAPRNVDCPAEPHLDFYHNHRYVGDGLVERRDDRFWYARFTPASSSSGPASAAVEPRVLESAPSPGAAVPGLVPAATQPASGPAARLSVGDEVLIRTQADIDQQRFVARVFDLTAGGALINAGENERLAPGQTLTVRRADAVVGKASIRDVQGTYAVVVPSSAADAAPIEFRLGDELRLAEPPPRPRVIGVIERLADSTLFTVRLTASAPPLLTPLAVRAAGRTVGVALLVTANESQAGGFVLRCSTTRSLAAGMQLVYEADARDGAGD
jgi:hypothetical protein